jgi:hypothetical protein
MESPDTPVRAQSSSKLPSRFVASSSSTASTASTVEDLKKGKAKPQVMLNEDDEEDDAADRAPLA